MKHSLKILDILQRPLQRLQPIHTILGELLNLRLEISLHEVEIIYAADSQEIQPWVLGTDAVHCELEVSIFLSEEKLE